MAITDFFNGNIVQVTHELLPFRYTDDYKDEPIIVLQEVGSKGGTRRKPRIELDRTNAVALADAILAALSVPATTQE